ncbi:TetR/AcrR family transcriptional regulator [Paenibacillus sp. TRM 82003]|nr:TetR/AcrR family transcriptional regulator [Paenibacillus sp. TRM 82003]
MSMDRKQQIIEAALRLFAGKGFHSTSIQDIVDEIGIAKGSVYIHFKSKEDLLLLSIQHMVNRLVEKLAIVTGDKRLTPRERMLRKLKVQFDFSLEHKEFIAMLLNEAPVHVNDEIKAYMMSLRMNSFQWALADLKSIYGEALGPYAYDAVAVIQALISHYTGFMIIDQARIDTDRLAAFLMDRLDDAVAGMSAKGRAAILSERTLQGIASETERPVPVDPRLEAVRALRAAAAAAELDSDERERVAGYALVLEHELTKPEAAPAVIAGLLESFKEFEHPQYGSLATHAARVREAAGG